MIYAAGFHASMVAFALKFHNHLAFVAFAMVLDTLEIDAQESVQHQVIHMKRTLEMMRANPHAWLFDGSMKLNSIYVTCAIIWALIFSA